MYIIYMHTSYMYINFVCMCVFFQAGIFPKCGEELFSEFVFLVCTSNSGSSSADHQKNRQSESV